MSSLALLTTNGNVFESFVFSFLFSKPSCTNLFLKFNPFLNVVCFSEKENGRKKPDRAREAKKTADNQNDSSDEEDTNQTGRDKPKYLGRIFVHVLFLLS